MDFNLATLLVFVTGALAGIVAALKIVSPITKTQVDDKIVEFAEKALDALKPKTA